MRKTAFLFFIVLNAIFSAAQNVEIRNGLKIDKTVSFIPKEYKINADTSLRKGVIIIEGNNITLDFKNIILTGSNDKKFPDEFYGVALWIRNSTNVTIKNLTVRGYRVALRAENTEGLSIESCDFSYNYRQHLNSTPEYEDVSDWLSHHHNENDEWLRYGAAIYLRNCNNGTIKKCRITNGQNALMMNQCNNNNIIGNFFCYNSGLGIGLYRSSSNQIISNNLDWNVRGYSHAVYQRGQDSAGILLYEQSNDNLIQDNSVTHSGDGLFLWAGQTTMDTGKGGCNGNRIINNDFSFAPTNGIEVTFSSNIIQHNKMEGCTYGIWGGYSYQTVIEDNYFKNNRTAIAIEHGQDNLINKNTFLFDSTADLGDKQKRSHGIRLWADELEPSDWAYPKLRDTRSMGYSINENRFTGIDIPVDIKRTGNSGLINNIFDKANAVKKDSLSILNIRADSTAAVNTSSNEISFLQKLLPGTLKGRKYILVNEWGPYDFKQPKLILRYHEQDKYEFEITGPPGTWKLNSVRNIRVMTQSSNAVPGRLFAVISNPNDFEISLEYTGQKIIDQLGNVTVAGKPSVFSYSNWQPAAKWEVKWFAADSAFDPYKNYDAYRSLVSGPPMNKAEYDNIRFNWWWEPAKGVPADFFATVAESSVTLDEGKYEFGITSDDGVKIYADGNLLIDAWDPSLFQAGDLPHFSKPVFLKKGTHTIRIEQYELSGFACLTFSLKKVN